MKKLLLKARRGSVLAAGLLAAVGAGPAYAANTAIIMWNSANPSDFESALGNNTASLVGQNFDGVTVSVSGVQRAVNPNGMTESNLFITNTTGTTQTLDIIAGANGFSGPSLKFKASATILTATGNADLTGSFFVDNTNSLNGTGFSVVGADIGDFDSGPLSGPLSFSKNAFEFFPAGSLYGLAESLTLTLAPGAFVGVQSISMDAQAVPELKTWAMLGVGFGLMAMFGLKRSRKDRLQPAV